MNKIDFLFSRKKANVLSIYFTAGYPEINDTVQIIQSLFESGVDLIEVGIPFSDPIADGPTIQFASQHSLDDAYPARQQSPQGPTAGQRLAGRAPVNVPPERAARRTGERRID